MRSCTGCSLVPSATLSTRLQAIWYGESRPSWPLRALSLLLELLVRLRRALYAHGVLTIHRLPRPVVVVGNLTVGGSGKTPLVIWLSAQLRAQGLQPGIVLRGYGGDAARANEPLEVDAGSDPDVVGDEALLLRLRTLAPVVVCRDRVRGAQRLLRAGVDVIIADDGLQHWPLGRDFEIAVVDAARGLGNGHLLPAGPLREPPARLGQVDAVVLNGEGGFDVAQVLGDERSSPRAVFVMHLAGEWLWPLSGSGEPMALARLAGLRVHAVAGIGNPQRFFAQLMAAGLVVIAHPFPDHHRYRPAELEFNDGLPLLMTEKDAVKCRMFGAANHWYLPVAASFVEAQGSALLTRLQRCLLEFSR